MNTSEDYEANKEQCDKLYDALEEDEKDDINSFEDGIKSSKIHDKEMCEEELEEKSSFKDIALEYMDRYKKPKEVFYNTDIPIETFDFLITDECHRSIYNLWRQTLEYFDACIGLTNTPSKQTIGFFNSNLVMKYSHQMAVADGGNVGYYVYRISTTITEKGSKVQAGNFVNKRDKGTRKVRWEKTRCRVGV